MPIYEYKCDDCGTKFEKLVRHSSDVPELTCPSCGKNHLQQELSTFAAHASSGGGKPAEMPMCPNGGPCNPGMCGMN
jgi:putative FmdB family regulatory protein